MASTHHIGERGIVDRAIIQNVRGGGIDRFQTIRRGASMVEGYDVDGSSERKSRGSLTSLTVKASKDLSKERDLSNYSSQSLAAAKEAESVW